MAIHISSGQISSGSIVKNNEMYVYSGGTANNTTVDGDGNLFVSSGGTANSTVVKGYWANQVGSKVLIKGYVSVFSGGIVNDTTVKEGGELSISEGGIASNTTLSAGGYLTINGSATNLVWTPGDGYLTVADGAYVTFTSSYSGVYVGANGSNVSKAQTINNLDNQLTSVYVMNNGVVNNAKLHFSSYMYVYSGGKTNSATINRMAYLCVQNGGVADNTTLEFYGNLHVYSGGIANNTTVTSDASVHVSNGGSANNVIVFSGGNVYAHSGGYIDSATAKKGAQLYVSNGGEVNNLVIEDVASVYVSHGATLTDLVWTPGRGHVYFAGGANVTFASSYTGVYWGSAGVFTSRTETARDLVIAQYNSVYVMNKAVVTSLTVGHKMNYTTADLYICSGGVAEHTIVTSRGKLYVSSGASATDIAADELSYLHFAVASNTLVQGTSNGVKFEMKNAYLNNYTINSGCIEVFRGGLLDSAVVDADSELCVLSGGFARDIEVNHNGNLYALSGGEVQNIKENGGFVSIDSGANVTFIANTFSGLVLSGASATLHSGTTAVETDVSSNGGLHVYSGGVASHTTVGSGGSLHVYNGGTLRGSLSFRYEGTNYVTGVVSAYQGAIVDFTVADMTAESDYLIKELARIKGAPTYTITVKADQADGIYKLAQRASEFTGTVTIGDSSKSYGSITVNGGTVTYNNEKYTLRQNDGDLVLVVGETSTLDKPTYTVTPAEGWVQSNVVITATFDSKAKLNQYSLDNGNSWKTYNGAITVTTNGTVLLRSQDENGFYSDTVTVTVSNIDNVKPTVVLAADTPETYVSKIAITVTASDTESGVAKIEYSLDKQLWQTLTGTVYEAIQNGTIYFRATDKVGNVSDVKDITLSKIDNEKPQIEVTGNPTELTEKDVVLTVSVSDSISGVDKVEYGINGEYKTIAIDSNGNGTVTITKNAEINFRVYDKAGNVSEQNVIVDKIEKDAPVITITANPDTWTNAAVVTVSATATDDASGVKSLKYWNGSEWVTGSSVSVTENNTVVKFLAEDNYGRTSEKSFTVDFIDRVAPAATVSGNTQSIVKELTLTVKATDDLSKVAKIEYSLDGKNWVEGSKVLVKQNGDVFFKVTDHAGNSTTVTETVSTIDNVSPTLLITGIPADYQDTDVILNAFAYDNFEITPVIEYSLDNKATWKKYSADAPCVVTKNQAVYFRATDSVGNVTEKNININLIDKDNPTIKISGYNGNWINRDIVLTAAASDASSPIAKVEYKIGETGAWQYGSIVTVTENCKVFFRATDSIGHTTVESIVVDKIDKTAPAKPVVSADVTNWTAGNVAVTAEFDKDSAKKEYSIDGGAYQAYNGKVVMTANGSITFRAIDLAGNTSLTVYQVENIDKTAPEITISGVTDVVTRRPVTVKAEVSDKASGIASVFYSLDNKNWTAGSTVTVSKNTTVTFKVTDAVGNVTIKEAVVSNINEAPAKSGILGNGTSQIVGFDAAQGKVGFVAVDGEVSPQWQGVWEWNSSDAAKWRVAGVGRFAGSKSDNDGLLLHNISNNTFAAWTDLGRGDYGYVSLAYVDGSFSAIGTGNIGGSSFDDVLVKDENGSFGVVIDGTTYHDIWHVNKGEFANWELCGAGFFGGNTNTLIVKNRRTNHLTLWANNDITFSTWDWSVKTIGYTGNDFVFAAAGDFAGDGIDDIIVRNIRDNSLWMWDNGEAGKAHWVVTPEDGFAVEGAGDYNGDGKDDLLVREYNTGWGGLGYYAFGTDSLWNDLNARIETDLESKFAVIA